MIAERDQTLARLQALVEEQAALRRVATLVAGDPEPREVFECVCEEVGTVLGVEGTNLTRFEGDGTQNVLAGWSAHGAPIFPVGGGVPLEGDAAAPKVSRTGRPERVDDYSDVNGELGQMIRAVSVRVTRTDAGARIEVRDDGGGGAEVGRGSGLRGLADRFEALGGRLDVDSRSGEGTRLIGCIPFD